MLGDGPLQKTRQKVEFLDLVEAVIFANLQKNSAPFYSAMDVFAILSLWEGLPLTLVEAQYSGLPCMVSEHVTKEVEICSQLKRLPLIIEKWLKLINSYKLRVGKINENIQNDMYNINCSVGKLRTLYV